MTYETLTPWVTSICGILSILVGLIARIRDIRLKRKLKLSN